MQQKRGEKIEKNPHLPQIIFSNFFFISFIYLFKIQKKNKQTNKNKSRIMNRNILNIKFTININLKETK